MTVCLLDGPTPLPEIRDDLTRREFITMLTAGLLRMSRPPLNLGDGS